jgi:Tfp pilus assembly protein PilF
MIEMDCEDETRLATLALCYQHIKEFDAAIDGYKRVLAIRPDNSEAYNNMGIAFKDQGKLQEAIEAYKKALAIKPDSFEVYINMGNALQSKGKLEEAIEAYKKALAIKPDDSDAYNNMGNALKRKGKLEEAIEAYKKALVIKADNSEVYNNMGNALQEQGKLKEAIEAYKKALTIKPDNAGALWNLSGTAKNLSEAKSWVEQCISADPSHLEAKLTLTALQFYEGNKSSFNDLVQSSLKDHSYMRSFAWAFELPELPEIYFHRWALFDRMIEQSQKNRPIYEYGVWRGIAFEYLIKTFKNGYGFDTFEGLPEDWHNEKAGKYSSDGNVPQIEGGEFIVGKFEDTLPVFFSKPRPKASIINFDADLYSSTICALNFSKPVIDRHTILIFDEFIMNKNWEQDEYKALNEFCLSNNYTYEVLALSFFTKQVAVRLIGI